MFEPLCSRPLQGRIADKMKRFRWESASDHHNHRLVGLRNGTKIILYYNQIEKMVMYRGFDVEYIVVRAVSNLRHVKIIKKYILRQLRLNCVSYWGHSKDRYFCVPI